MVSYSLFTLRNNTSPTSHEKQKEWLAAQLAIAAQNKLPVVFHERDAFTDFVSVFTTYEKDVSKKKKNSLTVPDWRTSHKLL